jgi:hypothetical protein
MRRASSDCPDRAPERKGSTIQRGFDRQAAALQDVGVYHRSANILVTEEFLHSSNVIAILKQVGGE